MEQPARGQPWWQQQPAIIAALVLFFPIGLILMWRYASWRVQFKWAWTGVFAALFAAAAISNAVGGSGSGNSATQAVVGVSPTEVRTSQHVSATNTSAPQGTKTVKVSPTAKPTNTPNPTATAKPSPTPIWKAGAPITQDSVLAVLKAADTLPESVDLGKPKQLGVDEQGGGIHVEYKTTSALNTTDYVSIGAQTTFSAMRALYANPRVQSVQVVLYTDFTDQLGNTSEDIATSATLLRPTADKVSWGGLGDLVLADNKHMFCISDAYVIALPVYNALHDTGCLDGPIRTLPNNGG